MYVTRDKKIAIEHYTGIADTRAKLRAEGFAFTEQLFLNGFWGVRFLVETPRGKGTQARRNRLQEIGEGR